MKKTTTEVKTKPVEAKPAPRIRTDWKAAYNQSVADAKRGRDAAESLSEKLAKERAELIKRLVLFGPSK